MKKPWKNKTDYFRATVSSKKGESSRGGTKRTGIVSHTCSWDTGVRVKASFHAGTGEVVVEIWETGGRRHPENIRLITSWGKVPPPYTPTKETFIYQGQETPNENSRQ